MIVATGIELRAGPACCSRTPASASTRRPHRSRRPQRCRQDDPDQGPRGRGRARGRHRDPDRRRLPAAGPAPVTSRSSPATASCRPADSTPSCASARRPRPAWAATRRPCATRRCASTPGSRWSSRRRAATPPSPRPPPSPAPPRPRGAHPRPAARHPLRWSASPRRAVANPLLRQRDPAARRADQPPRRRLDRLAARVPARLQGRAHHHQPRRRDARCGRQQGLSPRRQPVRARRLQRRLEDLPPTAETDEKPPQARARQRAEEGRRPARPGRQDAGQGDEGDRGPEHGQARRAAPRRGRGGAPDRQGGQAALPQAGRVRQDAAAGVGPVALRTARSRSSPTSTWRSTGAARWWCSASTVPARQPCCGCSPASTSPTRGRWSRATGCKLGYYAQEHENLDIEPHRPREHEVGRARAGGDRGPQGARLLPLLRRRRREAGRGALRRREDALSLALLVVRRPTCCCSTSRRTTSTRRPARRSSAPCRPTRRGRPRDARRGCGRCPRAERILLLPDGVEDPGAGLQGPHRSGLERARGHPDTDAVCPLRSSPSHGPGVASAPGRQRSGGGV